MIPNLVWRGSRGTGKKTALHNFLKDYAARNGINFQIQEKRWILQGSDGESEITTTLEESSSSKDEKKGLIYEISKIHRGFDVSRMSLQDKNYIQSILTLFQGTGNILLEDGRHILVIYHAHLLSEESVLLLQETLERYSDTVTILLTSEYPLHQRLNDFFFEIPYGGDDLAYIELHKKMPLLPPLSEGDSWSRFFNHTWRTWIDKKEWVLDDVLMVRQFIYTCMQRNLRWCDMIMYWVEVVERHKNEVDHAKYVRILRVLAMAKTGGGFVMLPSYRIPITWENFLIELIEAIRS
jgi:hypothetical protein